MNTLSDILAFNQPSIQQAFAIKHSLSMIEYACYLKEFEPEHQLKALGLFHQAASLKHHGAYYYLEGEIFPLNINHSIKLLQHATQVDESQIKLAFLKQKIFLFDRNTLKILYQLIVQYQRALLLINPELLVKILVFNPSKSFNRHHQAFLDAQLK